MHVEIYTRPGCSFCDRAKDLMNTKGIVYKEHKLNIDFTRSFISEKFSTAKTYPVIVVDGFYVGGFNEFEMIVEQQSRDTKQYLREA
jgi:glutaredoxin-related protein